MQADAVIQLCMRGTFTREEVEWFLHYDSVESKVMWLVAKPWYAKNTEQSFTAVNLLGILNLHG